MNSINKIEKICDEIKAVLVEKNKKYGNSALEPIGIFSKKNAETSILTRLDDKISRIKHSPELRKNDIFDLIGYLILLSISKDWSNFHDLLD